MALYWLTGGSKDGDGRIAEDRGPTDELVLYRDDTWKYGRGFYTAEVPYRYVETRRGSALVLRYAGATPPVAM